MSNLKDTVTTFNYFTKEPRIVFVKPDQEWEAVLRAELNPEVQATICIVSS